MTKKVLAAAVIAGMTVTSAGTVSAADYPVEKVMIGVEMSSLTDTDALQIMDYFDYLSQNMNVEFKYSEVIADADAEMDFIDECAISGCKGFITNYNVTGSEQASRVIDYGMYYYGMSEDEETYSQFQDEEYYLGSVNTGDTDYQCGYEMGKWCQDQGFKKVIYSNGGADFGVQMFIDRQQGFMDGVGEDMEVITVSGFPNDQFYADQANALAEDGVEAVATSINGVDYWVQPMETAGVSGKVKLASMGAVDEKMVQAFEDGSLSMMVGGGSIQKLGFGVGMICNAVDGNADALKLDGKACNDQVSVWMIDSPELAEEIYNIQENDKIYTADDVMSLCKNVNPDASHDTILELLDKAKLENLIG